MRRLLLAALILLLIACAALADTQIEFTVIPEQMRPGKTERISFVSPRDGTARVSLCAIDNTELVVIRDAMPVAEGANHLTWGGYTQTDRKDNVVPPGNYKLCVTIDGERAFAALEVGDLSPSVNGYAAPAAVTQGELWQAAVTCNMAGTLSVEIAVDGQWRTLYEGAVVAGDNALAWDVTLDHAFVAPDTYSVRFKLSDATGFVGTPKQMSLAVLEGNATVAPVDASTPTPPPETPPTAIDTPAPTHAPIIPSAVQTSVDKSDYWTYPIADYDEAALWDMLMKPITVINGDDQRETYKLRLTRSTSSKRDNIVGEITFLSQGVNVLETYDDGWSLVEAYNSSYGPDCTSRVGYGNTDELITGYVRTSLLKTITPRDDYALILDKLEQRMYVYEKGELLGSVLVSTGQPTSKQPWNETPAGEFLMVSRVGEFNAGNLVCRYGMRVNGGCLIHEVPYIEARDGTPDYSSTVKFLGQRASHGCIRVQKAQTAEGLSIKWLWDNIKLNTKVIIWDDTGRFLAYPDDAMPLYYNPNGGKYFHGDAYCSSVKDRYLPLTAFTYGELDTGSFAKLTCCPYCAVGIMTKRQIDETNRLNGF